MADSQAEIRPDSAGARAARTPSPGYLIRRASQVMTSLWSLRVGNRLLSPQYAVLASVYRKPEMDQVTIGQLASLDRSTLGNLLDRLTVRGLVTRSRGASDGRRNLVSLTPEGRELVEELAPLVADLEREMLECFDEDEREQFLHQLVRMIKHAEAVIAEAKGTRNDGR